MDYGIPSEQTPHEVCLDMAGVTGSSPVSPTTLHTKGAHDSRPNSGTITVHSTSTHDAICG